MKAVGLDGDNLEWLVQDAPAVPADLQERVLRKAQHKIVQVPLAEGWRPIYRLPRWAAVAAAMLVIFGATVALSPSVQAALRSLIRLIPGFGVTEVAPDHLVLAQPVTVADGTRQVTVTGVHGGPAGTVVHLRWAGIPARTVEKPVDRTDFDHVMPGGSFGLVLPDGTRLVQTRLTSSQETGTGSALLSIHFPPLPAATRSARLELPAMFKVTNPVSAMLTLTEAGESNSVAVVDVDSKDQKQGVTIGVSHLAIDGDRIRLVVSTRYSDPQSAQTGVELMRKSGISLTDDLGNTYPLLWDETVLSASDSGSRSLYTGGSSMSLWRRPGGPLGGSDFTAVFAGPVRPGAKSLRLRIETAELEALGSGSLRIAASDLPVGQVKDVHQTLRYGTQELEILQVRRTGANQVTVVVATQNRPEGRLSRFSVTVNGELAESIGSTNGRPWEALVTLDKAPETFEIRIENPIYEVIGPWTMEVKAP